MKRLYIPILCRHVLESDENTMETRKVICERTRGWVESKPKKKACKLLQMKGHGENQKKAWKKKARERREKRAMDMFEKDKEISSHTVSPHECAWSMTLLSATSFCQTFDTAFQLFCHWPWGLNKGALNISPGTRYTWPSSVCFKTLV